MMKYPVVLMQKENIDQKSINVILNSCYQVDICGVFLWREHVVSHLTRKWKWEMIYQLLTVIWYEWKWVNSVWSTHHLILMVNRTELKENRWMEMVNVLYVYTTSVFPLTLLRSHNLLLEDCECYWKIKKNVLQFLSPQGFIWRLW